MQGVKIYEFNILKQIARVLSVSTNYVVVQHVKHRLLLKLMVYTLSVQFTMTLQVTEVIQWPSDNMQK